MEEALSRAIAFEEAGADIIFVESPENKGEMWQINKALSKPTLANMVSGGRTPIFSSDRLEEMGFSIGIHPALGFLAAGEALKNAYSKLDNSGNVDGIDLEDFDKFSRVMVLRTCGNLRKNGQGFKLNILIPFN